MIEFDHRYVKICRICKVVFNPQKPTTHDVDWNGQQWFFPERPDFGGYGRDGCPFVRKLKQGL